MNETREYRRERAGTAETITVLSYLAPRDGDDDEIRVLRHRDGVLTEDGIAFHGPGGRRWLRERHDEWTGDGYVRTSAG